MRLIHNVKNIKFVNYYFDQSKPKAAHKTLNHKPSIMFSTGNLTRSDRENAEAFAPFTATFNSHEMCSIISLGLINPSLEEDVKIIFSPAKVKIVTLIRRLLSKYPALMTSLHTC